MTYTAEFYAEETRVALESALVVLPSVMAQTGARTVIDIGCGTGGWAHTAETLGYQALGVDLNVPEDQILCSDYVNQDISEGYPCSGYDLAICLEVAEHLPPESAISLVEGLSQATSVLFSAATPGQLGVGHINCQPHDYWHLLFARHHLYPKFIGAEFGEPVADFYRRNMFLYGRVR